MADQFSRSHQRKLRDQATASLDELRHKLEISPTKTPNRRQRKSESNNSPYSASVERLRELIKRHEKQSPHRTSNTGDLTLDIPPPDELAPLLNDQHTLLQHLEGQVSYYKDALNMLKQKAEIVINENTHLHEQLVSGIQNEIGELDRSQDVNEELRLSLHDGTTQTEDHTDLQERKEHPSNGLKEDDTGDDANHKMQNLEPKVSTETIDREMKPRPTTSRTFDDELARLKDVHSMKTKRLESMLKSTKGELEENKNYIKILETKQSEASDGPAFKQEGLCIKCAHNKAVIGGLNGFNDRVLKRMERENNELLETVQKQRSLLDDMKKKETDAFMQVKKSCELAEEIQLQKQELIMKHQQAMKEIERLKEEHRKQINKTIESTQKERAKMQAEHEENVGKLTTQLNEACEKLARTEIQLERVTRERLDMKTSLKKLEDYSENHDKEMIKKLEKLGHSLAKVTEENAGLKQQNQRLFTEKRNLEVILEKRNTFSSDELSSLRKKLVELTEKLEISNQECIRLTEELHICQKQLQADRLSWNLETVNYKNQIEHMTKSQDERENKLLQSLRGAEEKQAKTKTELGSMLESQIEICNSLKEEYKKLLQKQKDLEMKTRLSDENLSEENRALKGEISLLKDQNSSSSFQESELREQVKTLEESLANAETQAKTYYNKAFKLLTRYNKVLKERQHLYQEVEFLRSQLTDFRPNDKISVSDLDYADQPV